MRVVIRGGDSYDLATPEETRAIIDAALREHARGVKFMQLPTYLQGKPSASAITLGVTKGQSPVGPEQGYVWGITRLVVSGLTASSSSPDIVNIYLNDNFGGPVWWQFNGNTFGYNYSPPLILQPSSTLSLQNSGTIAATGLITVSGELWQVPAEQAWRLLGLT
jgi:hypothetical protein